MTTPPPSRRRAGRPSTTANVELPEGRWLIGPFGDYARAKPEEPKR